MKKIEASIRPEKLENVRMALQEVGYPGMMITTIEGHGKEKGVIRLWRGKEYRVELLPRKKIEIVVDDIDVEKIIKAIVESAQTGELGAGKIFIYNVEDAVRVHTGERGKDAIG